MQWLVKGKPPKENNLKYVTHDLYIRAKKKCPVHEKCNIHDIAWPRIKEK